MLSHVILPTIPSTVISLCFWNALTTDSVASPKTPSMGPGSWPSALKARCKSRTAGSSEPLRKTGSAIASLLARGLLHSFVRCVSVARPNGCDAVHMAVGSGGRSLQPRWMDPLDPGIDLSPVGEGWRAFFKWILNPVPAKSEGCETFSVSDPLHI